MTDFYLTLPSSVKNPQFENTSSRYVTHLPEVLHLERDKYVVAATDVIYPYSFVNVGRPLSYWIHMKNGPPLHVTFPAAQYSALDQIIDSLNYEPPRRRKNRLKRRAPLNPDDIDIVSTIEWSRPHKRAKRETDSEREERLRQEYIDENIAAFQAAQDDEEQEAKDIQAEIDENIDAERKAREEEEREEKLRREEIAKIKEGQEAAEQEEAEFEREEAERNAAYIAENEKAFADAAAGQNGRDSPKTEGQGVENDNESDEEEEISEGDAAYIAENEKAFQNAATGQDDGDLSKNETENVEEEEVSEGDAAYIAENEKAFQDAATGQEDGDSPKNEAQEVKSDGKDDEESVVGQNVGDSPKNEAQEVEKDNESVEEEEISEGDAAYIAENEKAFQDAATGQDDGDLSKNETENVEEEEVSEGDAAYIAENEKAFQDAATGQDDGDLSKNETENVEEEEVSEGDAAYIAENEKAHQNALDAIKEDLESAERDEQEMIETNEKMMSDAKTIANLMDEYYVAAARVAIKSTDETTYNFEKQKFEMIRKRMPTTDIRNANEFLYFMERDGRIHIDFLDPDIMFIEFETACAYFLGFHDPIVRKSGVAPSKVDLFGNVSTIYLYCDIVDPVIVGDQKNQLLSVIPCRGKYGEMIHHTIPHPRYLPIMNNTIDSIRVEMLSEFAEPIQFNWGSTIVVLHFKKIK